jgi:3-polyprenyl-4-hydroxybenzoate decarboxylase
MVIFQLFGGAKAITPSCRSTRVTMSSYLSNMMARNIIVCDQDVDIYDRNKVFWTVDYRVNPEKDIVKFPGWISALDPIVHPKDCTGRDGNKGNRLLIEATKPINRRGADEYFGERFAIFAYPYRDTMKYVHSNWEKYGITN